MSEIQVISVACDICHKQTALNDIHWNTAHTEALCPGCYDSLGEPLETAKNVNPVPIYVFYDTEGTVLHISTNVSSPEMWKEVEPWWGYKIGWIAVRHFDGLEQTLNAKEALQRKLSPMFGDHPVETDSKFTDTDFTVFDFAVSDETKEALKEVLTIRVNKEVSEGLDQMALHMGVNRSTLLRSILYEAVRQDKGKQALEF